MSDEINENILTPAKDYRLFGGLVLVAMIVIVFLALRSIFSLRPRVIP